MDFLQRLWETPWWVYNPVEAGFWGKFYRGFNLIEGVAWLACAGFVLVRWMRTRKTPLELGYAAAFLLFGLTDFREAWVQSAPLVLAKGILLGLLIALRCHILKRHYPQTRHWI